MSETLIFQSGNRRVYRDPEYGIGWQGDASKLCADMACEIESLRAQLAAAEREREELDTFASAVSCQLDRIAEHFDKDGNLLGDGKWRIDEILKYVKSIQEAERELIKAEESKPTNQGA